MQTNAYWHFQKGKLGFWHFFHKTPASFSAQIGPDLGMNKGRTASWSSIRLFTKHYTLVQAPAADAVVGTAVLQASFAVTILPPPSNLNIAFVVFEQGTKFALPGGDMKHYDVSAVNMQFVWAKNLQEHL